MQGSASHTMAHEPSVFGFLRLKIQLHVPNFWLLTSTRKLLP
jgi:hypothetical protein